MPENDSVDVYCNVVSHAKLIGYWKKKKKTRRSREQAAVIWSYSEIVKRFRCKNTLLFNPTSLHSVLHLFPKAACQLICWTYSGINQIFLQVQICLETSKHLKNSPPWTTSSLFRPALVNCPCLWVEKLLWWNTEWGRQHAPRWSFINQSAVWSPSSISHHRSGSVQKGAQAMSQGSTIYLRVQRFVMVCIWCFYWPVNAPLYTDLLNMYFHESCMLFCINSLERKHGSFVSSAQVHAAEWTQVDMY